MNLLEHQGKALLAVAGLAIPRGRLCRNGAQVAAAAAAIGGPVAIKAQVPSGKRGKEGGIRFATGPAAARQAASLLFKSTILSHKVAEVLVEQRLEIRRELYLAVAVDAATKGPVVLLSADGGMDVEAAFCGNPLAVRRESFDIIDGLGDIARDRLVRGLGIDEAALADFVRGMIALWRRHDLELLEVNPLVVLADGSLVAADCKAVVDDAALFRQSDLPKVAWSGTELELRAKELGLNFIELDGNVGVLANGAGLTMTTIDLVALFGGRPANFLEIGGDAYTKGKAALELVLANPRLKSLVVNFCGAYARTDVMAEGIVSAWEELAPSLPVFFSVHGTGEDEAVDLLRRRLGVEPFELMEDAVKAAVEAAR